jgi:hypothetical protein
MSTASTPPIANASISERTSGRGGPSAGSSGSRAADRTISAPPGATSVTDSVDTIGTAMAIGTAGGLVDRRAACQS